jgi:hypothetical protein
LIHRLIFFPAEYLQAVLRGVLLRSSYSKTYITRRRAAVKVQSLARKVFARDRVSKIRYANRRRAQVLNVNRRKTFCVMFCCRSWRLFKWMQMQK